MIIKHRSKPPILQKLDAIIPRLPHHFPKLEAMKKEAAIRNKGYIGERKVDYHLEKLANQSTILQDVSLRSEGKKFQIDTILITNYAIYCVESKHIAHTIVFNTVLNQFTQQDGDTEKGYRYPITQAKNHQLQLTNWLHEHHLYNIPVHYFIAISDPSTIINVIGDQEAIAKVVAHAEYIPFKIKEMDQMYKEKKAQQIQHKKIGTTILKKCIEVDYDILQSYHVKNNDILAGVKCSVCHGFTMNYKFNVWKCRRCDYRSKNAHRPALSDYLLLIKPWIRNKEAMQYLHLPSKSTTTRKLKSSGLIYDSKFKHWIK